MKKKLLTLEMIFLAALGHSFTAFSDGGPIEGVSKGQIFALKSIGIQGKENTGKELIFYTAFRDGNVMQDFNLNVDYFTSQPNNSICTVLMILPIPLPPIAEIEDSLQSKLSLQLSASPFFIVVAESNYSDEAMGGETRGMIQAISTIGFSMDGIEPFPLLVNIECTLGLSRKLPAWLGGTDKLTLDNIMYNIGSQRIELKKTKQKGSRVI